MRQLPFVKMHGLGNDFVVIDDVTPGKRAEAFPITAEIARALGHRQLGVGCDQILWLKPAREKGAAFRMEIFNTDGSIAEMCGNGIRAAALLWKRRTVSKDSILRVETVPGVLELTWVGEAETRVSMGVPKVEASAERLEASGEKFEFLAVDMGNPHAVIFVPDVAKVPLEGWGRAIETHSRFPKRTNVEFVQVSTPASGQKLLARVWERGAGATLACGTGACAVAVAAIASGRAKSPVQVELPGGGLTLAWAGPGKPVHMTGPATWVYEGVFETHL